MPNEWILIDANYLCYRALYSTGELEYNGRKTGVAYGFLREIMNLADLFTPTGFAFCFDSQHSLRRDIYPEYKQSAARLKRKEAQTEEDEHMWSEFYAQVTALRKDHLPNIGFKNIFCKRGYEADDCIASLCENMPSEDRLMIVSSDHDLYQLLSRRVSIWDAIKQRVYSHKKFRAEFNVHPTQWSDVKAFAGCDSDNVIGIAGVGEKTACKWIRGEIVNTSKTYDKFIKGVDLYVRNKPLVTLPFKGMPDLRATPDKPVRWSRVIDEIGAKSLRTVLGAEDKNRKTRRLGGRRP